MDLSISMIIVYLVGFVNLIGLCGLLYLDFELLANIDDIYLIISDSRIKKYALIEFISLIGMILLLIPFLFVFPDPDLLIVTISFGVFYTVLSFLLLIYRCSKNR